jgi:hypothetical protein
MQSSIVLHSSLQGDYSRSGGYLYVQGSVNPEDQCDIQFILMNPCVPDAYSYIRLLDGTSRTTDEHGRFQCLFHVDYEGDASTVFSLLIRGFTANGPVEYMTTGVRVLPVTQADTHRPLVTTDTVVVPTNRKRPRSRRVSTQDASALQWCMSARLLLTSLARSVGTDGYARCACCLASVHTATTLPLTHVHDCSLYMLLGMYESSVLPRLLRVVRQGIHVRDTPSTAIGVLAATPSTPVLLPAATPSTPVLLPAATSSTPVLLPAATC